MTKPKQHAKYLRDLATYAFPSASADYRDLLAIADELDRLAKLEPPRRGPENATQLMNIQIEIKPGHTRVDTDLVFEMTNGMKQCSNTHKFIPHEFAGKVGELLDEYRDNILGSIAELKERS